MLVAERCPGNSLEPSLIDRLAVLGASAKRAVLDPIQCSSHLIKEMSSSVGPGELLIPQRRAGALVGAIVWAPVAWLTGTGDSALEPC
jgi:hypothetical protein